MLRRHTSYPRRVNVAALDHPILRILHSGSLPLSSSILTLKLPPPRRPRHRHANNDPLLTPTSRTRRPAPDARHFNCFTILCSAKRPADADHDDPSPTTAAGLLALRTPAYLTGSWLGGESCGRYGTPRSPILCGHGFGPRSRRQSQRHYSTNDSGGVACRRCVSALSPWRGPPPKWRSQNARQRASIEAHHLRLECRNRAVKLGQSVEKERRAEPFQAQEWAVSKWADESLQEVWRGADRAVRESSGWDISSRLLQVSGMVSSLKFLGSSC